MVNILILAMVMLISCLVYVFGRWSIDSAI